MGPHLHIATGGEEEPRRAKWVFEDLLPDALSDRLDLDVWILDLRT